MPIQSSDRIASPPPSVLLVSETFRFGDLEVRGVALDGRVLLLGHDLCRALGIDSNPNQVFGALDPDMKVVYRVRTAGGPQSIVCLTEAGAYAVALRGRKPESRQFRRRFVVRFSAASAFGAPDVKR